jgi:hypothetical protein
MAIGLKKVGLKQWIKKLKKLRLRDLLETRNDRAVWPG